VLFLEQGLLRNVVALLGLREIELGIKETLKKHEDDKLHYFLSLFDLGHLEEILWGGWIPHIGCYGGL
jgi:hypothetical protein